MGDGTTFSTCLYLQLRCYGYVVFYTFSNSKIHTLRLFLLITVLVSWLFLGGYLVRSVFIGSGTTRLFQLLFHGRFFLLYLILFVFKGQPPNNNK
ncbi:hypothetical protein BDC45DRAFT_502628 [Circinella umbellata]|nr:hypothetical protein BDC45DRAFT_502628 [Circinella umbellata]